VIKLSDSVPLLKGESNFDVWREALRRFMNAEDLDLWSVVTSTSVSPISAPLAIPTDDEVRTIIEEELG
jgi:hypothetical protein